MLRPRKVTKGAAAAQEHTGCGTRENLEGLLASGRADLIAVGRAFLANPDLVQRLGIDAPLNAADESSFYGGTDAGYIDYPALEQPARLATRLRPGGPVSRPCGRWRRPR